MFVYNCTCTSMHLSIHLPVLKLTLSIPAPQDPFLAQQLLQMQDELQQAVPGAGPGGALLGPGAVQQQPHAQGPDPDSQVEEIESGLQGSSSLGCPEQSQAEELECGGGEGMEVEEGEEASGGARVATREAGTGSVVGVAPSHALAATAAAGSVQAQAGSGAEAGAQGTESPGGKGEEQPAGESAQPQGALRGAAAYYRTLAGPAGVGAAGEEVPPGWGRSSLVQPQQQGQQNPQRQGQQQVASGGSGVDGVARLVAGSGTAVAGAGAGAGAGVAEWPLIPGGRTGQLMQGIGQGMQGLGGIRGVGPKGTTAVASAAAVAGAVAAVPGWPVLYTWVQLGDGVVGAGGEEEVGEGGACHWYVSHFDVEHLAWEGGHSVVAA